MATRAVIPPGRAGYAGLGGRGHHQAAATEAQIQRLQYVGAALAQHVGAGDAEVGRARLDVDRNVGRLHHQELDAGVGGGDEQPPAGISRRCRAGEPEALDRRLVETALGQRDPEPAHAGTSASVSRSSENPDRRHRAAEPAHQLVVAATRARRAARARDVHLEMHAGVVVQPADLTQVVDHVPPLVRRERAVQLEQVGEARRGAARRFGQGRLQRLPPADHEGERDQAPRVARLRRPMPG